MKEILKKKDLRNIFIILGVAFVALLPLFLKDYHKGHDTSYHVSNIVSLTEQMEDNLLFPSNIVGNIANDMGYGTRLFYPPLSHTTTAYVNLITDNIGFSLKIVHFLVLFSSGLTMYFLSKRISKDDTIGILSAIIYMLFPYHLSDIYIRDSLAECFLFIFPPMIVSSLYELYSGNVKKFYPLFILGYVGGMLSHLTMMVYFTVLIFIFLIIKFRETIKYLKPFIISSIFILLITSPFLITLLEHKFLGNYTVFIDGVMSQGIQFGGLNLFDYFNMFYNYKTFEIRYYFDLFVLIMLIFTIFNYKKLKNKTYNYIIIFSVICMLLSTKLFPWDLLPQSFRIIQFPWRFEVYVALFISLLAPICITLLKGKSKSIIVSFVIYFMLALSVFNFSFNYGISFSGTDFVTDLSNVDYNLGMGWQQEYLPSNTYYNFQYYSDRDNDIIIKSGDGEVNVLENNTPYLSFEVTGDVVIELPRLFYFGYTLNDGETKIYENEYGFIETKVSEGTYYLDYTRTNLEKIFTILSLTSIIVLVVFVRRNYEKN